MSAVTVELSRDEKLLEFARRTALEGLLYDISNHIDSVLADDEKNARALIAAHVWFEDVTKDDRREELYEELFPDRDDNEAEWSEVHLRANSLRAAMLIELCSTDAQAKLLRQAQEVLQRGIEPIGASETANV